MKISKRSSENFIRERQLNKDLKCAFIQGPIEGLDINLVGEQNLHVTEYRVLTKTEFATHLELTLLLSKISNFDLQAGAKKRAF